MIQSYLISIALEKCNFNLIWSVIFEGSAVVYELWHMTEDDSPGTPGPRWVTWLRMTPREPRDPDESSSVMYPTSYTFEHYFLWTAYHDIYSNI